MSDSWRADLLTKIERRDAVVGIIGLGYVGLPLALRAVESGFRVVGIETDTTRLAAVGSGHSYLVDVDDDEVSAALASEKLSVTDDFEVIGSLDVIVICVPTPLQHDVPDLSFVLGTAETIASHLRRGTLVVLESTTYPGTTEELLCPRLERGGLSVGRDFALAFSPERIDPGNDRFGVTDIPKVVGGVTPACGEVAEAFYSSIVQKVTRVRRAREAEMAKLLENTYRQVNIALANEFAMVAHELDIDIWEVIDAAATKPFGFHPFYPGIGIGGHCIAVDPVYLAWRIRELGRAPFRLVELAREVDASMPLYVTQRLEATLDERGKSLEGARVLVLGVTYKPDVSDTRESRALDIIRMLHERGAEVAFNDPFVEELTEAIPGLQRTGLEDLASMDVVCILTHHSAYDWRDIVARASLVFDARGVTRGLDDPKIVRL